MALKSKAYQSKLPVIIVGNITVGGSGKTPVIMALVDLLKKEGWSPGVVSRGYGRNTSGLRTVSGRSSAEEVGDEPMEIFERCRVPVVVAENRVDAVRHLEHTNVDVVLCDDGLQHYALGRDIEISVVGGEQQFGNEHCLPLGPLREPVERLASVDYVLSSADTLPSHPKAFAIETQPLRWLKLKGAEQKPLDAFDAQKAVAICGLGQPAKFFNSLNKLGLDYEARSFPDHHRYKASDFRGLESTLLLMTAKDAVKCRSIAPPNSWYLKIECRLSDAFKQDFMARLTSL